MAFKSVVNGEFFFRILELLRNLEEEHGAIALAFLESSQLSTLKAWELTLAAPWLDRMNLHKATSLVTQSARARLGELSDGYAGTHIRRMDDYLVKNLIPALDISGLGMPYRVDGPELSYLIFTTPLPLWQIRLF